MALVRLERDQQDGVRVLTLADPDRRNALSVQLQRELGAAIDAVAGAAIHASNVPLLLIAAT